MSYVALYRKFRPQTFDEVKGQEHIVRTLRNQVKTGRLQHAYLFCGTRGTGKTSVAKILAKAVNCDHPENGNPCGACDTCSGIAEGTSMNVIEIDAASNNGVDNIRDIIEEVQYRPTHGNYKVYIIDEVHMLSPGAFNALLKTLEEPPSYVIFILATTEVGKIPITILSRCQRYDFHRIDVDTIAARLRELTDKEGVAAEEKALRFVARAADGSMRDALSLLDRCLAFYMDEELTYDKALKALGEADTTVFSRLTASVLAGNAADAMKLLGKQISTGIEIGQLVSDYIWYLRNLLIVRSTSVEEAQEIIDVSHEQLNDLMNMAEYANPDALIRCIDILSELQNKMRYATNKRVLTEIAILQMAKPEGEHSPEAVSARMSQIELKLDEVMQGGYALPAEVRRGPAQAVAEEEADFDAEMLPAAAPEDLKEVCANWKHLIGGMEDGFLKNRLKLDATPQFNAETLENKLYLELSGNETADRLLINTPDNLEELTRYLERKMGKHIEVEMHLATQRRHELKNVDINGMMANGIAMDVEEDDDDAEDDSPF